MVCILFPLSDFSVIKSCFTRIAPHRYQAKKDGLPQNNKNEHNTQNFRFGVFQNLKLMGMWWDPKNV